MDQQPPATVPADAAESAWCLPWSEPEEPFAMQPAGVVRSAAPIVDPIVEPLWNGSRMIAHFQAGAEGEANRLALFDEFGRPVEIEETDVGNALRESIAADDAVVDGILTSQALRGGEGAAPVMETSRRMGWPTGVDAVRRDPYLNPMLAFVGVDLLRLDGESLLDLPLLERKRLLESVLLDGARVRISAYVRPPFETWLLSWKASGFTGAMLKGANSRYEPGGRTSQWRKVTQLGRRR